MFTSWSDLYKAMQDAYAAYAASGNFHISEFSIDTGAGTARTYKYRDPQQLLQAMEGIKPLVDRETGAVASRTYAKQGGTGRW